MNDYLLGDYVLKRFEASDWKLYRAIRLKALAISPAVYGSHYQLEWEFDDQYWIDRLENDKNAIWGLYHKDELVGVTAANSNPDDPEEVRFTHSFILPEHRGKGLSALFYKARIDWARERHIKTVIVTHRGGNDASRAANQRHGFQYTHTERRLWPDGEEDDHLFYKLKL
jgi:RimJ/RimL family protein N-acetyltransferase